MSVSNPPPESEQLIATGDNTQTDQPTGIDSSKQQTVTLTLLLNDILEDGSQLDGRVISVSGQMTFAWKQTTQVDSTPKELSTESKTSMALQSTQYADNSENGTFLQSINESETTFKAASGLLMKCADNIGKMKAALDAPSGSNKESKDLQHKIKRKIKDTAGAVIDMLKDLAGDTATVTTDDDNNDHSPDDDKDSDGSKKPDEDPKEDDNSEGPPNPPKGSSENNEDSKEDLPTDSGKDQSADGSTENYFVETTTTEIDKAEDSPKVDFPFSDPTQNHEEQAEPSESIPEERLATKTSVTLPLTTESGDGEVNSSASELDEEKIVEEKKLDDIDSVQQKTKEERDGRTEEAPSKESSPQQEDALPQEPSALEGHPLSVSTEKPEEQEEMEELPAPGVDKKVGNFEETPDAGIGSQQTTEPAQEPSTPAESAIEETPSDNIVKIEESPIEETSPQQGAKLLQEPSVLEDPPLSALTEKPEEQEKTEKVTDIDAKDMKHESKDGEPSPPAPGVDKKGGDSEETPDAGSGPQPSTPTKSAIEKTPIEGKDDDSGDATLPEPKEVQEHDSKPAARTLSKNQRKKFNKKENKRNQGNKNMEKEASIDEEDKPLIPMDVMLSLYFVAMLDIREKQLNPREHKISGLLEEISVFHRSGDYEKYASVVPQNLFEKVLGEGWNERKNIASNICRQLIHFSAQETAKTCSQDVISYLSYHHDKFTSPTRPKTKVLSMNQLFAKFNEEIFSWITSQWAKSLKQYMTHRRLEVNDKSIYQAWKPKLPKFSENPRVVEKIANCKANLNTFEDRLIAGCYEYLTSPDQTLKKYHDILDIDFYYNTRFPKCEDELLYFGTIFEFDREVLKNLYYGNAGNVPAAPAQENAGDADKMEDEDVEEEENKAEEQEFISEMALTIFFSTMKSIDDKKMIFEQTNMPSFLAEIVNFHKTKHWKTEYMNNTEFKLTTLFVKVFGEDDEWRSKKDVEHQLCRMLEERFNNPTFFIFAKRMLAYLDYHYIIAPETTEDEKTVTKSEFVKKFTVSFDTICEEWICTQLKANADVYIKHHEDRAERLRKFSKDVEKYNWKPKPPKFAKSNSYTTRIETHLLHCGADMGNYLLFSMYQYVWRYIKESNVLDVDFDEILSSPKDTMRATEFKYFTMLFGFKNWSHWFADYLVALS